MSITCTTRGVERLGRSVHPILCVRAIRRGSPISPRLCCPKVHRLQRSRPVPRDTWALKPGSRTTGPGSPDGERRPSMIATWVPVVNQMGRKRLLPPGPFQLRGSTVSVAGHPPQPKENHGLLRVRAIDLRVSGGLWVPDFCPLRENTRLQGGWTCYRGVFLGDRVCCHPSPSYDVPVPSRCIPRCSTPSKSKGEIVVRLCCVGTSV